MYTFSFKFRTLIDLCCQHSGMPLKSICDELGLPLKLATSCMKRKISPRPATAIQIAKAIGVSVEWMFDEDKTFPPRWTRRSSFRNTIDEACDANFKGAA